MKKFLANIRKSLTAGRLFRAAALAIALSLAGNMPVHAQTTTMVKPRQYYALSNTLVAVSSAVKTNGNLYAPSLALNGTNQVGGWAPTMIPFGSAHPIGLACQILNSNAYFAGTTSNLTVTVFAAYDVGGGSATAISPCYGTNFVQVPLFTWTIAYGPSSSNWFGTNIATAVWEPATSLGYWVSNAVASNLTVNLIQSDAP